jgi:hypothetical protein
MSRAKQSLIKKFSQITKPIKSLKIKYIDNCTIITDLLTRLIITFSVVLIVGGLYLIFNDTSGLDAIQRSVATQSAISSVSWVPGIPFSPADLTYGGIAVIGLVIWIIGVDLLLVGLGLWVRHRLARLAAIMIFLFAAVFQFIELLYSGFFGAPSAVTGFIIDAIFVYFLFSRFDSPKVSKK